MYALREELQPLPASQFWAGRYEGVRGWLIPVTPLAVRVNGLPEPERPHAYAMTILLGQLVLQGVRFTTLSPQVCASTRLPQFWPPAGPVTLPSGTPLNDDGFLDVAGGKDFRSTEQHIELQPWQPATDLTPSQTVGGMVELPTICGKHVAYYPAALVGEARQRCDREIFASLETELIDRTTFNTRHEAEQAVFAYIEGFYNPRRRHSANGQLSPAEYERRHAAGAATRTGPPRSLAAVAA